MNYVKERDRYTQIVNAKIYEPLISDLQGGGQRGAIPPLDPFFIPLSI